MTTILTFQLEMRSQEQEAKCQFEIELWEDGLKLNETEERDISC